MRSCSRWTGLRAAGCWKRLRCFKIRAARGVGYMLKNMLSAQRRKLAFAILLGCAPVAAQRGPQSPVEPFRFRFMGPSVGNRISAAAGLPGDPTTYYVGRSE